MVKLRRIEKQSVTEAKQVGTLYHVCTLDALVNYIIPNNELRASGKYWNKLLKTNQQVCFTRDPLFVVPTDTVSSGNILFQFVVDGDKLSEKYKVTPFNYTTKPNQRYREKEEDVIGPISNFKSYVNEVRFDIKDLDIKKDNIQDIIDKLEAVKNYLGSIRCYRSELPFLTRRWNVRFAKVKNPNYRINTLDEFIDVLKEWVAKDTGRRRNVRISGVDTPDLLINHITSLSSKEIKDILQEHPTWVRYISLPVLYDPDHSNSRTIRTIKTLIENGVDVNMKDGKGNSILFEACKNNDVDLIKMLVENGADINIKTDRGYTPLGNVCCNSSDNVELARFLVDNGAIIKDSCLINAVGNNNINIVKFLLGKGLKVTIWDNQAITEAVWNNNFEMIKLLLENGADANAKIASHHDEPILTHVCTGYNPELVKLLIDYGADVNYKDRVGHTALKQLVYSDPRYCTNKLEMAKILIEHGADVDDIDVDDIKDKEIKEFIMGVKNNK